MSQQTYTIRVIYKSGGHALLPAQTEAQAEARVRELHEKFGVVKAFKTPAEGGKETKLKW